MLCGDQNLQATCSKELPERHTEKQRMICSKSSGQWKQGGNKWKPNWKRTSVSFPFRHFLDSAAKSSPFLNFSLIILLQIIRYHTLSFFLTELGSEFAIRIRLIFLNKKYPFFLLCNLILSDIWSSWQSDNQPSAVYWIFAEYLSPPESQSWNQHSSHDRWKYAKAIQ